MMSVDLTELLLCLSMLDRKMEWPDQDSLMRCKQFLEAKRASGLDSKQLAKYPDVAIDEDLFMKLPLWNDFQEARMKDDIPSERAEPMKRLLFHILAAFEEQSQGADKLSPLAVTTGTRAEKKETMRSVTARRIFGYLGLGSTPVEGLEKMISLLPPLQKAEEETLKLQHLYEILFCTKMRPAELVTEHMSFEAFLDEFQEGEEPIDSIPLDVETIVAHPTVMRLLSTHSNLHARYRIGVLFPNSNQFNRLFPTTSNSEEPCGLRPSISLASLDLMKQSQGEEFDEEGEDEF